MKLAPSLSPVAGWNSLRRLPSDPLLTPLVILLVIALAGAILAMVAAILGLMGAGIAGLPIGERLGAEAWGPFSAGILKLAALGCIAGGIVNVLQLVGTIAERAPFQPANAARIERLGWRVIELEVIAWLAALIDVRVGGDINGFDVSVGMGPVNAVAVALVLFTLARVFRHGNRLESDLEGTV